MTSAQQPTEERMTVAAVLVDLLARAGVREVFGVTGSTIMPLLDAIADDGRIRYVGARYEQSAADMASGYARASARLGVVMTHVGPGATSCLTTMVAAGREGTPLLLVTGNEESHTLVREPYHDWDVLRVMGALVRFSYRVGRPADLPHVVRRALGQALRDVPQPVHIDLPEDVALAEVSRAEVDEWLRDVAPVLDSLASARRVPLSRPAPNRDDVERIAELLTAAEAPVLLLGEAVQWADEPAALVRRCEELGVPYATTHGGRGGVPPSARYVGTIGRFGSRASSAFVGDADVVVALGAELTDVDTVGWRICLGAKGALVAVHPDARKLDLRTAPTVGVVADVGEFVDALATAMAGREAVRREPWLARAASVDRYEGPAGDTLADGTVSLDALLVGRLVEAAPDSWAVAVDPGFGPLTLTAAARFGSSRFLYPFGFGYMGFAVPHAIGAVVSGAVAGAVVVIGDGSFFMSMASLESVASLRVPVVVAVLDDGGFGSQRQKQREAYGRNLGVDYDNPDIAKIGAALGLDASWVRTAEDVETLCAGLAERDRGALVAVERARNTDTPWYEGAVRGPRPGARG